VDDARNGAKIAEAARAAGSTLDVLIEVDTGMDRAGVESVEEAITPADRLAQFDGVRLTGVTAAFVINGPVESKVVLDRIAIGRFAEPDEIARAILWMSSEDASYLTGELLVVDGALSVGLPPPTNIGGQHGALLPCDQTT
jgi:alanine racemase